jgi:hypothetical protein
MSLPLPVLPNPIAPILGSDLSFFNLSVFFLRFLLARCSLWVKCPLPVRHWDLLIVLPRWWTHTRQSCTRLHGWHAGTTTLCQSWLLPPVRDLKIRLLSSSFPLLYFLHCTRYTLGHRPSDQWYNTRLWPCTARMWLSTIFYHNCKSCSLIDICCATHCSEKFADKHTIFYFIHLYYLRCVILQEIQANGDTPPQLLTITTCIHYTVICKCP